MKYIIREDTNLLFVDDNEKRIRTTYKMLANKESLILEEVDDSELETDDNGTYYLKGFAPKKNKSELAEEIRLERNRLLAETDYLLAVDYPISSEKLEVVKEYRQALRDIPEQENFPYEVEYPVKEF